MARRPKSPTGIDTELDDLPPELRWRTWMGRAEAVIFANPTPVGRETVARVVGKSCNLDALIADIRAELVDRPFELVAVAGGWQHRTRKRFADAIRLANGAAETAVTLSPLESQVLTAIAYFQPLTRKELGAIFGREISRDLIADLRSFGLIASGPRSPRAGAPMTYVTTGKFLSRFGFNSLQELPERQQMEDAGLLSKESLLSGDISELFGRRSDKTDDGIKDEKASLKVE